MMTQFDVLIEKDSEGYFVASVPALKGCHTQAKSLDILMERIREAIPSGTLKALADGHLADVSRNLMVAFSAVILALIAAAVTYWVVNVRRRWYAQDLARLAEEGR